MKKIGIITLNTDSNFGNKLQNYALRKCVLGYKDFEVSTIWIKEQKEYKDIIKGIIKKVIKTKGSKRVDLFKKFNQYINIYWFNIQKDKDMFDYYIIGSDQVWNYTFKIVDLDLYFSKFAPKEKNISYAASFGISNIEESYKEVYKEGLNNFKMLSVREDRGKEIVNEITGREDVEVVIDPTMLLNSTQWDEIAKKPKRLKENEKYILNYFLGDIDEKRKLEIERIAKENDCKIINILDKNDPFYISGPSEFLYLEKHAFLICTDSFHSSVFAILYNRPFIIFEREDKEEKMNSRIDTLIKKFKLKNRKFEGAITKDNLQHDYTRAYEILETEREKAKKFLEKALEIL